MKVNHHLLRNNITISCAKVNLIRVLSGFDREALWVRRNYVADYGHWAHLEFFWSWFKKFKYEGWQPEEEFLQKIAENAARTHYSAMNSIQIADKVILVLSAFLFRSESMTTEEKQRMRRFTGYVSSMIVALE